MNDKIGVIITISQKSLHLYNSEDAFLHCVRNIYKNDEAGNGKCENQRVLTSIAKMNLIFYLNSS